LAVLFNTQKLILDGNEYEYFPAEVKEVDYTDRNPQTLYKIKCSLIGAFGSMATGAILEARPLHSNIKHIPIVGEVVLITKTTGAYANAISPSQDYYYTSPVSIQSSVHHNGIPGVTTIPKNIRTTVSDNTNRNKTIDGIPNNPKDRLLTGDTIDPFFPERLDVYPIQPYPGDIIFEGRWGQSIRFGSTVDDTNLFPVYPLWSAGLGATGNPITIISNGTNPKLKGYNRFTIENPDTDDASIWLTSGQTLRFNPASRYYPSITSKKINSYRSTKYAGNQILITSERILLNSRQNELIGFSKKGVGFSTDGFISLDAKKIVETESSRINLGLNAVSPALLGDKTMMWMKKLCDILVNVIDEIVSAKYPTAVGPTAGPPLNMSSFLSLSSNLSTLKDEVEKLKSNLVFLNENGGGPTEEAMQMYKNVQSSGEYREEGAQTGPTDVDGGTINEWGEDSELTVDDEYYAQNDGAILNDDDVDDVIIP
jgi:hypothetical protein